jgi:hypothetical protein
VVWIWVFVGIAVVGLVVVGCYVVWLAHKTADVASEVAVLIDRAGRLGELLGEIRAPEPTAPNNQT